MKIFKCSFCGKEIAPGTGIVYVKKDGTIYRFCSRKCERFMIIQKRDPRKQKWIRKSLSSKKAT